MFEFHPWNASRPAFKILGDRLYERITVLAKLRSAVWIPNRSDLSTQIHKTKEFKPNNKFEAEVI